MKLDNKYLHDMVENFGVNHLIDNVKPEDIEEHDIVVILRTIQTSKEILIERLVEYAAEKPKLLKSPVICVNIDCDGCASCQPDESPKSA
jgi:hypothetical protein